MNKIGRGRKKWNASSERLQHVRGLSRISVCVYYNIQGNFLYIHIGNRYVFTYNIDNIVYNMYAYVYIDNVYRIYLYR